MRGIRVLLVLLVLAGLLAVSSARAFACSCAHLDYASPKYLAAVDAIFVGRVIARRDNPKPIENWMPSDTLITFAVTKDFKGASTSLIEVASNLSTASCGFNFEIGRDYLVWATKQQGVLVTGLCSGTQNLESATELVRQLGEPRPPPTRSNFLLPISISTNRNAYWNCRRSRACRLAIRSACELFRATPGLIIFCR